MRTGKSVNCPLCSKKFFLASFPFHVKVCAKQLSGSFETLICPICNVGVRGDCIAEHAKSCVNKINRSKQNGKGLNDRRICRSTENILETDLTLVLKECKYCKRRFRSERITAHENICKKISVTPKRNIFNSSLKRQASTEALDVRPKFGRSSGRTPQFCSTGRAKKAFGHTIKAHRGSGRLGASIAMTATPKMNIRNTNEASQSNPMAPDHSRYNRVGHYY